MHMKKNNLNYFCKKKNFLRLAFFKYFFLRLAFYFLNSLNFQHLVMFNMYLLNTNRSRNCDARDPIHRRVPLENEPFIETATMLWVYRRRSNTIMPRRLFIVKNWRLVLKNIKNSTISVFFY